MQAPAIHCSPEQGPVASEKAASPSIRIASLGLGSGLWELGLFVLREQWHPVASAFKQSVSQGEAPPPRLFQSLAMRRKKPSDSVNISISLCWEVGMQFTV